MNYTTRTLLLTTSLGKEVCEFVFSSRRWRFFSSLPEGRRIVQQLLKRAKIEESDPWNVTVVRTTTFNQYFEGNHSYVEMDPKRFGSTTISKFSHETTEPYDKATNPVGLKPLISKTTVTRKYTKPTVTTRTKKIN